MSVYIDMPPSELAIVVAAVAADERWATTALERTQADTEDARTATAGPVVDAIFEDMVDSNMLNQLVVQEEDDSADGSFDAV